MLNDAIFKVKFRTFRVDFQNFESATKILFHLLCSIWLCPFRCNGDYISDTDSGELQATKTIGLRYEVVSWSFLSAQQQFVGSNPSRFERFTFHVWKRIFLVVEMNIAEQAHFSKITFINQKETFFIQNKWCHLILWLHQTNYIRRNLSKYRFRQLISNLRTSLEY